MAGTALAGAAAFLASGTTAQYVLLGLAIVIGLPAYLAFPFWPILLAQQVIGPPLTDGSSTTSDTTRSIMTTDPQLTTARHHTQKRASGGVNR